MTILFRSPCHKAEVKFGPIDYRQATCKEYGSYEYHQRCLGSHKVGVVPDEWGICLACDRPTIPYLNKRKK